MSIKVAVRCRPFNRREKKAETECIISMHGESTVLKGPQSAASTKERQFTFDNSFWSFDQDDGHFADQSTVYREVGESLLDEAFKGKP